MSLFRSGGHGFSKQIGHSAILPGLGNKDIKLLQDLITAEKFIGSSATRLADDFAKAAEALKQWGGGEGDDLWDVLTQSKELLVFVSQALAQFSAHEGNIRVHMKAIRTREEGLDEMKRRRRQVAVKADSADKKLSKMSSEHKQLTMQTDLLKQLQNEMRQLDSDIMVEEARLGDFKRQTTKDWMALKFGGLLEMAEKLQIVGEAGKEIIEEIPLDNTTPGFGRAPYLGQDHTKHIFGQATKAIAEVIFQPATGNMSFHYDPAQASPQQGRFPNAPISPGAVPYSSVRSRLGHEESQDGRYGGGLPPQPEPQPLSAGMPPGPDGQYDRRYPSDGGPPPVDEFGHQQRNPWQQTQAQTMGAAGPGGSYPSRMPSVQAGGNSGGRFASMPNRNWDSSARINNTSYDEPPSPDVPSVPSKDGNPSSMTRPPPPTINTNSRFSDDPSGPGHLGHSVPPRRTASGISDTNADLVLAYYHSQDATEGRTEPSSTNPGGGGVASRPSYEQDAYAADAYRSFNGSAQTSMPPVIPLHPQPPPRLPRPTSLRDQEDIKAANAAAAQEIARELDQLAWRSAIPQQGAVSLNDPPARSSPRVAVPQSSYDAPGDGPLPALSLNFTETDAHLDFPGMTIRSPVESTSRQPSMTYNAGRRSPPPSFEVAMNPATPNDDDRKAETFTEPGNQSLPGRSPSAVSGASHVSTSSSLSTLPPPNPPFRAVTPSRGTTTSMPSSPVDGPPSTNRTISAGAFKRFRGSSLSPAGLGTAPPLTETPSYSSDISGGSNYASAPSSPNTGGRPLPAIGRSVSGPRGGPAQMYDPSPLREEERPQPHLSLDDGQGVGVGVAIGSPSNSYPDGFTNTNKNRFTIGDAGWKPSMPGRYGSSTSGLGEPIPEAGGEPPASRGGYGSGNYATALE